MAWEKIKQSRWVYLLFLMGVGSLFTRTFLDSRFGTTALFYVAIPFVLSFILFHFRRTQDPDKDPTFGSHMLTATVVMLGSSAILFEGFICVLFFYPIYVIFVALGFAVAAYNERSKDNPNNNLKVSFIPLIVVLMSLEGIAPSTSFERQNTVTRSYFIEADVATIQANLAAPINLPKKRHWFLSIFPIPVETRAGSLEIGDVHEMDFVYKRWFFTNTKKGQLALRLDSVSDEKITTSITKNTSYLASYLSIKGTEVEFEPIENNLTRIDLTMHYERLLDPAWYFGALQKYAVSNMCDYFVKNVYAKDIPYELIPIRAKDGESKQWRFSTPTQALN